jgi:hypothetical protein
VPGKASLSLGQQQNYCWPERTEKLNQPDLKDTSNACLNQTGKPKYM